MEKLADKVSIILIARDRQVFTRYKKFKHGTGSANGLSMIAAYTTAFVQKIKSLYLP